MMAVPRLLGGGESRQVNRVGTCAASVAAPASEAARPSSRDKGEDRVQVIRLGKGEKSKSYVIKKVSCRQLDKDWGTWL